MSSGQWEVVGKGRKDKHNNKKLTKSEKQKFVDNAPKVEDLLPLSQVKTLYSALDNDQAKTINKPTEKSAKTKENEAKKTQKKQPEKKKEKEPVKEKPPKSLEAAIALLKISDLTAMIEIGKVNFKGTPLVWLKSVASYINSVVSFDYRETSFSAKSFDHPLCLLQSDIRSLLKKEIKEVSESHPNIVQTMFDCWLTSMAVDMAKGSPITGFKILLQLLATHYPSITVANLDKHITLRNSYQNKQAIGLSILWALGQGGFRDLSVGLKVWQTAMLPLCEMRSYTRYVLDYIKVLLARQASSKGLGSEQYFSIIDSIFSEDLKLPNPASVELKSHAKQLREIASNLQPERRLHLYFEPLLHRISSSTNPLKDDLVRFSVSCLINDQKTFSIWKDLYADNLSQSACILKNIHSDLNSFTEKVPKKSLLDTISSFSSINASMARKNQKGAGLQDCNRLCEVSGIASRYNTKILIL